MLREKLQIAQAVKAASNTVHVGQPNSDHNLVFSESSASKDVTLSDSESISIALTLVM